MKSYNFYTFINRLTIIYLLLQVYNSKADDENNLVKIDELKTLSTLNQPSNKTLSNLVSSLIIVSYLPDDSTMLGNNLNQTEQFNTSNELSLGSSNKEEEEKEELEEYPNQNISTPLIFDYYEFMSNFTYDPNNSPVTVSNNTEPINTTYSEMFKPFHESELSSVTNGNSIVPEQNNYNFHEPDELLITSETSYFDNNPELSSTMDINKTSDLIFSKVNNPVSYNQEQTDLIQPTDASLSGFKPLQFTIKPELAGYLHSDRIPEFETVEDPNQEIINVLNPTTSPDNPTQNSIVWSPLPVNSVTMNTGNAEMFTESVSDEPLNQEFLMDWAKFYGDKPASNFILWT